METVVNKFEEIENIKRSFSNFNQNECVVLLAYLENILLDEEHVNILKKLTCD